MRSIDIGGRRIGPGNPCFIIAEAGVNHNGQLETARLLVDASLTAGVDAVKFQTWVTEKLVAPSARMAKYQEENVGADLGQYEMLKALELSYDEFTELSSYASARNALFFSTPDEEDSADFLEQLGVPLFKIGSAEVTNLPFLRHVARKGKPVILSTGMSNLAEVADAVRAIEETGNMQLVLLHCVSNYPASPADYNLRAMNTMAEAFGYPVGLSDHTLGPQIALAAVALGACVIEKHFTLDKAMAGPDHPASSNVEELAALVRWIRDVEAAMGDGVKAPAPSELDTREVVRKSMVAARTLRAGESISEVDLAFRRTSGGLDLSHISKVVGRRLICDLKENDLITLEMVR
ncbi:MAG TPA: N-acetylneuraminate synthase [Blastocatellia bacterium]